MIIRFVWQDMVRKYIFYPASSRIVFLHQLCIKYLLQYYKYLLFITTNHYEVICIVDLKYEVSLFGHNHRIILVLVKYVKVIFKYKEGG